MYHTLANLAKSRRLDEDALFEFAMKDTNKYGICYAEQNDKNKCMIGTWHVNDLVDDFRKHLAEKAS